MPESCPCMQGKKCRIGKDEFDALVEKGKFQKVHEAKVVTISRSGGACKQHRKDLLRICADAVRSYGAKHVRGVDIIQWGWELDGGVGQRVAFYREARDGVAAVAVTARASITRR